MKLVLPLLLCACITAFAVTPFPSSSGHKVILKAKKSPYILENNFVLPPEDSLIIEAGVEVYMSGYAKLLLRGAVKIDGTPKKPVAFRSADSSENWSGIYLATDSRYFVIRNLIVENAFRNTVANSSGLFEKVRFVNNYYGLWLEDSPKAEFMDCHFSRNRFAFTVGKGKANFRKTYIQNNVFGIYVEKGADFTGDTTLVKDNLETDIRRESEEMASQGRRISRKVWNRIEAGF